MVPKYAERWGDIKGNTPGMDILTSWEEFVPRLVVGYEGGSWEKAPLWNIHTNRGKCMIVPPMSGEGVPVGFVELDWGGLLSMESWHVLQHLVPDIR